MPFIVSFGCGGRHMQHIMTRAQHGTGPSMQYGRQISGSPNAPTASTRTAQAEIAAIAAVLMPLEPRVTLPGLMVWMSTSCVLVTLCRKQAPLSSPWCLTRP